MKVVLPWPDKRLFPNWKRSHHWRLYRPAEKQARADGAIAFYAACMAGLREVRASAAATDKISLTVTFYPPDKRKRDDDGLVGSIKNYRDGIADALGVDDAKFSTTYVVAAPEKPGRVEVIL